jgi:hypothetical protein
MLFVSCVGKTFTMEGFDDSELRGIIPRSVEEIFNCRSRLSRIELHCAVCAHDDETELLWIVCVSLQTFKTPLTPMCASSYAHLTSKYTVSVAAHRSSLGDMALRRN